ncbi:MAG: NAD(P)-dependent oxidoreductase [Clostridia bacterium]|nr:NAD(P)-dependent oxidoreductase [Clostridia bacterium]
MREIHTAVVTGPTGAIGHALCSLLLSEGIETYAVCRPGSPRAKTLPDGIRTVFRDASDLSALPSDVDRADAFFHLAWTDTVGEGRNDRKAQEKNVGYTLDACRAAAALGCSVFVGAGSQAEYGRVDGALRPGTPCRPENEYGKAKLEAGRLSRAECKKLGIAHIWARILSVYGPFDGEKSMIISVAEALLAGKKPALTKGEQLWDYIYSDDAADALFLAAKRGRDGAVYPVGSGVARPLREYVEMLRDAIDPSLPLGFGEVPYGERQVMRLEADIRALASDTGFHPETDFKDGIKKTVQYVRTTKNG